MFRNIGLGFLEGVENCYLVQFQDHSNPPPTDDSTQELVIQEVKAMPMGQNDTSQIVPPGNLNENLPSGGVAFIFRSGTVCEGVHE